MNVTLSVGPGQHGTFLVEQLVRKGNRCRVIQSWPAFTVVDVAPGAGVVRRRRLAWYEKLVWLTWACWRRIPGWGRYQTPQYCLSWLHDAVAQRYIGDCDLFIGWSEVSLYGLRKAKRLGRVAIVEQAMAHIEEQDRLVREEYDRFGIEPVRAFPRRLIQRIVRSYREANAVSVLSTFARRSFLERGFRPDRVCQTPLGVDVAQFRPRPKRDDCFRVVYVGRMELQKGVQYLLEAFSSLKLPGAELCLIGPMYPEMRGVFRKYEGQFAWLGEVPRAQLPAYYAQASVAVLFSIQDGFGLVLLEAMACGVPVICTQHSAGPDLIEDGIHGFVLPIRDVEGLKERLAYLYEHPEECRAMGREARERVVARFTLEHYGDELVSHYQELLSRRNQ